MCIISIRLVSKTVLHFYCCLSLPWGYTTHLNQHTIPLLFWWCSLYCFIFMILRQAHPKVQDYVLPHINPYKYILGGNTSVLDEVTTVPSPPHVCVFIDLYWRVLLLCTYWQEYFQRVYQEFNPPQFILKVFSHMFSVSSFPDFKRIALFLHHIIGSMYFSWNILFWIERMFWMLGWCWALKTQKPFASIYQTRIQRYQKHRIYYCLG